MKELILIKLGGSVITDKSREYFAREANISRLAKEIRLARPRTRAKLIVGHGAGSFAHIPASIYRTKEGIVAKNSIFGMGVTEEAAKMLNQIVVKKFINEKIPTYAFSPGSFIFSDAKVYIKS
jgi:isopentenyl phosphate kinase